MLANYKQFIVLQVICIASIATIYAQDDDYNNWLLEQRLPNWTKQYVTSADFTSNYKLSAYINPFYLEADFNGDGELDIVIAIESKLNHKKGFVIIHHQENIKHFIIGAGVKFDNDGDDFSWMDVWKVQRDLSTHKLTYKDDGDIDNSVPFKLDNIGIDVKQSESGGGIIYFDGKEYKWVQTSE